MMRNLGFALVLSFVWLPLGARGDVQVVREGEEAIRFDIDGKLFTRLHIGPKVAKPYLWPILSSEAVPLTRAWPMEPVKGDSAEKTTDHKHQKSAWFCHGDVVAEGVKVPAKKGIAGVDFWSEDGPHGKIKMTKVLEAKAAGKEGSVVFQLDWVSAEGALILSETRSLKVIEGKDGQRLIVMDTDLKAKDAPVTFDDTKEGSFGIRVRDAMAEKGGKGTMTSSEGKTREPNIWGKQLDWVDYSGPLDGKTVGITVMADPANSVKTCWHARAYGLLAANPFGRSKSGFPAMRGNNDLVKIKAGESLKLRFAILVHDGDAKSGKVSQGFDWFKGLPKS